MLKDCLPERLAQTLLASRLQSLKSTITHAHRNSQDQRWVACECPKQLLSCSAACPSTYRSARAAGGQRAHGADVQQISFYSRLQELAREVGATPTG